MKLTFAAIAALGMALAPVASAQASCDQINQLVAYSLDDFDEITGEEVEDDFYESLMNLAGAEGCRIDLALDSVYMCRWEYADRAAAVAAYSDQEAVIRSCLASWSATSVLDKPPVPEEAVSWIVRSGSDRFEDVELLYHFDDVVKDGVHTYETWFELAYYLL